MTYKVYEITCDETRYDPRLTYFGKTCWSDLEGYFRSQLKDKRCYDRRQTAGFRISYPILEMTNPRIHLISEHPTMQEAMIAEALLVNRLPCVNLMVPLRIEKTTPQRAANKSFRANLRLQYNAKKQQLRENPQLAILDRHQTTPSPRGK